VISIREDRYTGEVKCKKCDCWFTPEYGEKICPYCENEIDLKIEEERREQNDRFEEN